MTTLGMQYGRRCAKLFFQPAQALLVVTPNLVGFVLAFFQCSLAFCNPGERVVVLLEIGQIFDSAAWTGWKSGALRARHTPGEY